MKTSVIDIMQTATWKPSRNGWIIRYESGGFVTYKELHEYCKYHCEQCQTAIISEAIITGDVELVWFKSVDREYRGLAVNEGGLFNREKDKTNDMVEIIVGRTEFCKCSTYGFS